jgi:hypothetical protein
MNITPEKTYKQSPIITIVGLKKSCKFLTFWSATWVHLDALIAAKDVTFMA